MDAGLNKEKTMINEKVVSLKDAVEAVKAMTIYCELDLNGEEMRFPVVSLVNVINALEALPPSAQPEWIPVTERLPENNNDVLVTDGTDCAVAYWRTDAQAWDDCMHGWCDLYGLEVAAWMPLPEKYDGKG